MSLALAAGGCGGKPPLASAQGSPSDLARAMLAAVADRNPDALRSLALSETEFRDHVWPELPAARPERNLPFSYVWGDLHQKSEQGLQRTLLEYGGQRFELVDVKFGRKTEYDTYRVHRDSTLIVRGGASGESTIRLCGSMIEKDGAWKVFSFVVDE